jgi:hypothetical protein
MKRPLLAAILLLSLATAFACEGPDNTSQPLCEASRCDWWEIEPGPLAFAPAPLPPPPLRNPEWAIQTFAGSTRRAVKNIAWQKGRLLRQLRALHSNLISEKETARADAIRDYIALVESADDKHPLEPGNPAGLLRKASTNGKYRHLLAVLYVPADRSTYPTGTDYGSWTGREYAGYGGLPNGYWVYEYPRWFIWKEVPRP